MYRGMDKAALDAAYNNGEAVGLARRDQYLAALAQFSAGVRRDSAAKLDLRYGEAPRQRLDFFFAGPGSAPTLAFIHGGYWQGADKESHAGVAAGPLARGINVALIEYTIAPAIRMDGIVAEIKQAIAWLRAHLGELGAADDLYLAGHSAGGHLTASAIAEPGIKGGIAISGIFDLEPIRLNYLNDKLGLDEAEARRNSPILHLPQAAPKLVVAVGGRELAELQRQSADYYAAWTGHGLPGDFLPLPRHDHFSILDELITPEGRLTTALMALVAA